MDEKTLKTILEALANEIERLKLDIYLKNLKIEELKKERAELLNERTDNDGKL